MPKALTVHLRDYADSLKRRYHNNTAEVWDPVRRKYVVLSPEEMVRQLVIQYLVQSGKARLNRLSVERKIVVVGQVRRYDLLIHNCKGDPIALVECKAPEIRLDKKILLQIGAYNLELGVPHLLVTNGPQLFYMTRHPGSEDFEFMTTLPDFEVE
jgi:hypothetical protein